MFNQLFYCVVVCTSIVLISCNSNTNNINEKKISLIDIKGAKALMVAPRTSAFKANYFTVSSSNMVFAKVKSDDSIEEVNVYDSDGTIITGNIPKKVFNVSDSYVIIVFDATVQLVSKTTGTAYDLTPAGAPYMHTHSGYHSTKMFYTDSNDNIYYISGGRIKKISAADPDRITVENYSTDLDTVNEFAVDSSGNVLYSRQSFYSDPMVAPCRIRKANGGLYNTGSEYMGFFTGLDGKLYTDFRLVNDGSSVITAIYRINIDSSYNVSFLQYGNVGSYVPDWGHNLYFNDRILNVNCQSRYINEIYTSTGLPRPETQVAILQNGINVTQSNTYIYVAKSDGTIIKINPVDYTYSTLMSNNNYEFYIFDVTSDDIVLFNALRLSDGKKVLGKIIPDGTVTIIDDTLTENVLILQKIK